MRDAKVSYVLRKKAEAYEAIRSVKGGFSVCGGEPYTLYPPAVVEAGFHRYLGPMLLSPIFDPYSSGGSWERILLEALSYQLKVHPGWRRKTFRRLAGIINEYIRAALDRADPAALRVARSFSFVFRGAVYWWGCRHPNHQRLAEVFPALAYQLYAKAPVELFRETDEAKMRLWKEAILGVENRSLDLKATARRFGLPWTLRFVKPALAHRFERVVPYADFFQGTTTRVQYLMFEGLRLAGARSDGFRRWVLRHTPGQAMRFRTLADYCREVALLVRWAEQEDVREYGIQEFHPGMGWARALAAARRFREALEGTLPFPEPWVPGGQVGDYTIVPLRSAQELQEEGALMNHCVATYSPQVVRGASYIYSVRQGDTRVATVELQRTEDGRIFVAQNRGYANAPVSSGVAQAVEDWLADSLSSAPAAASEDDILF